MADGATLRVNAGFGQPLDATTLARARRSDMAAFAEIYARYGRHCFALALRLLGEPAAAEDVVQDVFLKLMDSIRGFRGDAPFGAWLKRMTANAAIDRLRKTGRDDSDVLLENMAAVDLPPGPAIDAWSLLAALPPRARAIVVLHYFEGYSHAEMAALFGRSESYSKSILARAMQRLKRASERST